MPFPDKKLETGLENEVLDIRSVRRFIDNLSLFHAINPIGNLSCHGEVLLDDSQGRLLADFLEGARQIIDHVRRQSLCGFIHENEFRVPQEGSGNQKHLAFPTAEMPCFSVHQGL